MGNKTSTKKSIECDFMFNLGNDGSIINMEQSEERFTNTTNDVKIYLDFKNKEAKLKTKDESFILDNIYFHTYKNLINELTYIFVVKHKNLCKLFLIKNGLLMNHEDYIHVDNIDMYQLSDVYNMILKPCFNKKRFKVTDELLMKVEFKDITR